jgi:hypothetical protein
MEFGNYLFTDVSLTGFSFVTRGAVPTGIVAAEGDPHSEGFSCGYKLFFAGQSSTFIVFNPSNLGASRYVNGKTIYITGPDGKAYEVGSAPQPIYYDPQNKEYDRSSGGGGEGSGPAPFSPFGVGPILIGNVLIYGNEVMHVNLPLF